MFAGHYGAGLGAKAADARLPLWVLYPYSHSLVAAVGWSALAYVLVRHAAVDAAATAGLLSTAIIVPALAWLVELRRRPRPLAASRVPAPGAAVGR